MKFELLKTPRKLLVEVRYLWLLYRHPASPRSFKIAVWGLFLYLLLPIDIIPDFIPVLGQIDDFLVLLLGCKVLARLCPREAREACRRQAETG